MGNSGPARTDYYPIDGSSARKNYNSTFPVRTNFCPISPARADYASTPSHSNSSTKISVKSDVKNEQDMALHETIVTEISKEDGSQGEQSDDKKLSSEEKAKLRSERKRSRE